MSSADREDGRASELIERLLVDPEFRAEFRRDPVGACSAAGLPELAAELGGSGRSMDTLVVRESRSSLAGVVMAVAVEGMSIAEAQALMHHGLAGVPRGIASCRMEAPCATRSRTFAALRRRRRCHVSCASCVGGRPDMAWCAGARIVGAGVRGVGAGSAAGRRRLRRPRPNRLRRPRLSRRRRPLRRRHRRRPLPDALAPVSAPPAAADSPAAPAAPAYARGAGYARTDGVARADGLAPRCARAGATGPRRPAGARRRGAGVAGPAEPGGGAVVGSAAAASSAVGAGGSAGALASLLDSPRLSAAPNVRTFLASGGVDPRMVSVLDSALANHTIGLGQVEAVSDPVHVQAVDIVSVDGQPVGPNNFGARDLVTEIAALDPSQRPDEIGTPWPIHSQGFFSDAGAANRLHLAFEMPGTDTPAAGAASQAPMAAASPAGGSGRIPGRGRCAASRRQPRHRRRPQRSRSRRLCRRRSPRRRRVRGSMPRWPTPAR